MSDSVIEDARHDRARRKHFKRRVRERIGPSVNSGEIEAMMVREIAVDCSDVVRFRCSVKAKGRAIFRVMIADAEWFIVACKETGRPVTVLPRTHDVYKPGFDSRLWRKNAKQKKDRVRGRNARRWGLS